jgi:hypothetical protein
VKKSPPTNDCAFAQPTRKFGLARSPLALKSSQERNARRDRAKGKQDSIVGDSGALCPRNLSLSGLTKEGGGKKACQSGTPSSSSSPSSTSQSGFILRGGGEKTCQSGTPPFSSSSPHSQSGLRLRGGGEETCQSGDEDRRNIPPSRKRQLSPEEKHNYFAIAGKNILQCLGPVVIEKKGQKSQLLSHLLHKVSKGQGQEDQLIFSSILSNLMECPDETDRVRGLIRYGNEKGLKTIIDKSRERPPPGVKRHTAEEVKSALKWVASLGEVMSSSANRFRLMIPRREVYQMYRQSGVKSILLTMLTEWPEKYWPKVQKYIKMSEEAKKEVPFNSSVYALYCIHQWKESKFEGECPPFGWGRTSSYFWKMVNMRKPGCRAKLLKTYFSTKLKHCPRCSEVDEDLAIYEELLKTHLEEKDLVKKQELQKRLDQWAKKVESLKTHKDKHERQRVAVQKWKKDCHLFPGVCLVYEDFCNIYESDMKKMLNLVMVVIYHNGKEVIEKYYDSFCRGSLPFAEMSDLAARGSQDNHVYKDAWLLAFYREVFKKFHTIIKTGDNGSALKSYDTFHLHALLMQEHGVRIIYHTLCPYHGENICDGIGNATEKSLKKAQRRTGRATGNAFQTAEARSMYMSDKVQPPAAFESLREFDRYMI